MMESPLSIRISPLTTKACGSWKQSFSHAVTKTTFMSPRISPFILREEETKQAMECFLQTKTSRFRRHFVKVQGREVQFLRSHSDPKPVIVHSLTATALQTLPPFSPVGFDVVGGCADTLIFFPLKLHIPPSKSRVIYLTSEDKRASMISLIY